MVINISIILPLFSLGIFLGFSILQLLEYGISFIITSIKRFHGNRLSRVAGSEHIRQFEQQEDNDSQYEMVNGAGMNDKIKLGEERMGNNNGDLTKEVEVLKQEMSEMKNGVDNLFKMIENIV